MLVTRSLGPLEPTVVGLGCNNFGFRLDQEGTTAVVDAALEAGINFFDTADIYGGTKSEEFLGVALGSRRDGVLVASKFGMPCGDEPGGGSPEYVRRACEASLRRLGMDHLDLYQLHVPDPTVPIDETLGAMAELVDEGKVRALGCSNFDAAMLARANAARPGARFVSVQNQYSLLWREPEDGLLDELDRQHAGLLPYYPLANGLLTGKYRRGEPLPEQTRLAVMPSERTAHWLSEPMWDKVEAVRAVAEEAGLPMVTLAFSWLLSRPQVSSVIAGATSPAQVAANAASAVELDEGVVAALDAATAG
jgi:aryl-alcohol dehydrogenase-like predicted oxidoreductase